MKKLLLTPALILAMGAAHAQLALQNFNAAGLPTGWSLISDGKSVSTSITPAYVIPLLNANAWIKFQRAAGDSSMMTTSYMSPAGAGSDRYLITPTFNVTDSKMLLTFDCSELSTAGTSPIEIKVSTTGAASKSNFSTSLGTVTAPLGWSKLAASLSAFDGMSINVAFVSNGSEVGFPAIDNVQTELASAAVNGSLDQIVLDDLVSTGATVKVVITNKGATNIANAELQYDVDGGAAVVQTFSGLNILPMSSATLTFTTTLASASAGAHTLNAKINKINSAVDPIVADNMLSKPFVIASRSVNRNGLMEEFTSSTCPPCKSFNATFDPLVLSMNANDGMSRFNIIKFQMNWPSPGNDVSYNNDGMARRTYYSVSGIPDHFTNGMPGGAGNATEISNSKVAPSYMDITGTYTITKDSVLASVTITPYFTLTGANYRLHMAAVEDHYVNPGNTTGQTDYYHVMRQMNNTGNGLAVSSFTDGVPQTFKWGFKYTVGSVTQMSNKFWGSPINGSLVAFVQDNNNKNVLQSIGVRAQWRTNVSDVNKVVANFNIYPNPATDHSTIAFSLENKTKVSVQIVDLLGRTIESIAPQEMNAGNQVIAISTQKLATGTYMVNVTTDNGTVSEKLQVVK